MKIAVAGIGYVGLSNAVLLAQHHEVVAFDLVQTKVDLLNQKKSPIVDSDISTFLETKTLSLTATTNYQEAVKDAIYLIVATPTNYDPDQDYFDTRSVDRVIEEALTVNPDLTVIIKSTIPLGHTLELRKKLKTEKIIFSPEFLREGQALYDNLHPSRIVVGDDSDEARLFAFLLKEGAETEDIPILFTNSTEAEAIKLFANTYLAMRVSFFNELDTYAEQKGLDTKQIIEGISHDPRIGSHYNNPSFGYGGYCLPKDTKQLLASFKGIPNNIIQAVVDANETRKDHIADMIIKREPQIVGIYRLTMKTDSDNFRQSAIQSIIKRLIKHQIEVVIYEPGANKFEGLQVIESLTEFKALSDVIVANRLADELKDVHKKVYTRDVFNRD